MQRDNGLQQLLASIRPTVLFHLYFNVFGEFNINNAFLFWSKVTPSSVFILIDSQVRTLKRCVSTHLWLTRPKFHLLHYVTTFSCAAGNQTWCSVLNQRLPSTCCVEVLFTFFNQFDDTACWLCRRHLRASTPAHDHRPSHCCACHFDGQTIVQHCFLPTTQPVVFAHRTIFFRSFRSIHYLLF